LSKKKEKRTINNKEKKNSKDVTRPETAIDLNIIAISSNKKNMKSKKNLNKNRFKAIRPNPAYYQMMKDSIDEENKLKVYHNQNGDGLPGPGQYIDIIKSSGFYKDTIPYPEFKQFFLSNNERFPEKRFNDLLGPTTYYENNNYYKSSFATEKILKKKDRNKIKKTPFSSREKRFTVTNNQVINEGYPGPGTYDPKIFKDIDSNKFNNKTNTFNFRSKRFTTAGTDIKWKNSIPGPGSYINPYTAKGTSNTLLINGLYLDIRKGKDLLRPKSKITQSLKKDGNNVPDAGMFNPALISSIAYNNRKKANSTNNNINIAFNTKIRPEENKIHKTNLGPGYYYNPRKIKQRQINPPFSQSETKFKKNKNMFEIGPGYYESRSYFDWNKKSYNVSFN
jgi:hypothetical protein